MPTYVIVDVIAGMVLGLRFMPFVLVPTSAIVMTFVIGSGLVRGDPVWQAALMAFAGIASLQFGFLAGAFIHHVLVGRSTRISTSASNSSAHPALDSRD